MEKSNIKISIGDALFLELLTLLFIALKLLHYIDWSWWWVLAPLWIPFIIAASFMLIAFLFALFLNR